MRQKLLNIIAAAIIFIGALVVITERYQEDRTIVIEQGLGPIAMTLISLIVLGALSFLVANFKAMIYQAPFGTFAVVIYGTVVVVVSGLGYLWVDSIQKGAQANLDVFLDNMQYHADTLLIIAGIALFGVIVSMFEPFIKLFIKKGD